MSPIMNRREALAALASTAAVPLLSGCSSDTPPSQSARPDAGADALAMLDQIADNYLRFAQSWRPRSAWTPARGPACDPSSPIARLAGSRPLRTRCART